MKSFYSSATTYCFCLPFQDKSREELEAEIIPRFTNAVQLGLKVLEDAIITVEVKPSGGNYKVYSSDQVKLGH